MINILLRFIDKWCKRRNKYQPILVSSFQLVTSRRCLRSWSSWVPNVIPSQWRPNLKVSKAQRKNWQLATPTDDWPILTHWIVSPSIPGRWVMVNLGPSPDHRPEASPVSWYAWREVTQQGTASVADFSHLFIRRASSPHTNLRDQNGILMYCDVMYYVQNNDPSAIKQGNGTSSNHGA